MRQVRDVIGHERAADAAMLRPAHDARLVERAVEKQLAAAVEEVEQARRAVRAFEAIVLLHGLPGHAPALRGQRVTGAHQLLLLHQHLLVRGLPFLW
jgi:hypothetical protein